MSDLFQFEQDFVESLRCIPMAVRLKLDTCGVKLKLTHWHQFNLEERQKLLQLPCKNAPDIAHYEQYLQGLVEKYTGTPASRLKIDPHPPWLEEQSIPPTVLEKAATVSVTIPLEKWANLSSLQRFILIKLSRPGHENKNFLPALKEFNLI
ncbi:nitrate reductase associated protein [Spirulina subsalsa FACHB-351]|uniref:Nitrate reductase associated protein n=1 Tax=Spirulina subsalsa FACHB-351 TaxID=234711 RepID=A0ABT3L775_9CYAN|nr:nitrate reductase associated protein [Spirulina subsalsa]MCW6037366.1 nitrate reductase associated protein [Spirulina subsalsa FACHB-351]